jgi:regulator of replication initiation timing
MQSKVDQLVDDAKTFLEIIESYCRQSLTDCVPMLKKINELIDEVSILETERQRLVQENAKLKKDVEAAPGEVIRLAKENEQLLKRIDYLKEWNNNQTNIIQSIEKRYFTDGSHDYAHTYKDIQTGMKYVEIHSSHLYEEEDGYDYALKA